MNIEKELQEAAAERGWDDAEELFKHMWTNGEISEEEKQWFREHGEDPTKIYS